MPEKFKIKLMDHQIAGIKRARTTNLLLAWEPGLGKTLAALEIFREKWVPGFKALVVCPILTIKNAWVDHIEKFTEFTYSIIYSVKPKKRRENLQVEADIYLINKEQFKILSEDIRVKNFDMIILDESSGIKNHKSAITKCSISFAGIRSKNYPKPTTVPHRYCLSGTPSPNGREEFWGQITFCQPGLFHTNFYPFRDRFFYSISMGPGMRKWIFKDHTATEFETTMKPAIDVVRKADALDLPPVVDQYYNIDLSSKEMAAYKQMKETLVLEFEGVMVLSQYQITKIQKLRQLACSFVFDQDHKDHWVVDKTAKDDALLELLDKLSGRSVVIWVDFRPLFSHLSLLLNEKCVILDQQYGSPEEALRKFRAEEVKIIIANPASAGHGINGWQNVASEAIYYTSNWSYELRTQSSGRLDRIGQKNKVTNFYLIAKNTVDSLICQKVESKKQLSDLVLNHLRG